MTYRARPVRVGARESAVASRSRRAARGRPCSSKRPRPRGGPCSAARIGRRSLSVGLGARREVVRARPVRVVRGQSLAVAPGTRSSELGLCESSRGQSLAAPRHEVVRARPVRIVARPAALGARCEVVRARSVRIGQSPLTRLGGASSSVLGDRPLPPRWPPRIAGVPSRWRSHPVRVARAVLGRPRARDCESESRGRGNIHSGRCRVGGSWFEIGCLRWAKCPAVA
jgi:hypothetical protein